MTDPCEKASDEDTVLDSTVVHCDPCLQDGCNDIEAHGYCVDCGHNLCSDCFNIHLKPLPMRHHRLRNKKKVSTSKPATTLTDKCVDKCCKHMDEIVKYYCKDHKQLGCTVCITLGHRACNVGYIPDLAEKIIENDEYKTLKDAMDSLAKRIGNSQLLIKQSIEELKQAAARNIEEIAKFCKEVHMFFEKLESEARTLEERVKLFESVNVKKLETLLVNQSKLADNLHVFDKELKEMEHSGQFCCIFVNLNHYGNTIGEFERDMYVLESTTSVAHSEFHIQTKLPDLLQRKYSKCGSFVDYNCSIDISDASELCDISDLAVLSKEMIAASDRDRKVLKIIGRKEMKVIMTKRIPHIIKYISKFEENKVVIWFANTIEVFSVSDGINTVKKIRDVRLKWPLVYTKNAFLGFTTSRPFALCILSMSNKVEKTIAVETNGENVFVDPMYISTNNDSSLIYVSDLEKDEVICVNLDGEVKSKFRLTCEWTPRGLAIAPDGTVYVCDTKNHNIYILTPNLEEISMIDGTKFGMRFPMGLSYCVDENKLFVGLLYNKYIAVLNV